MLSGVEDFGDLAQLPAPFWEVPYVAKRYPGAVPRGEVHLGANCQLWAYEVLAFFGWSMPDLRSDELWDDRIATALVSDPRTLDLVLFSDKPRAYGAHVGLWNDGRVAHLCREVGRPVIWDLDQFSERPRYQTLLGFKRPLIRS